LFSVEEFLTLLHGIGLVAGVRLVKEEGSAGESG
jgi:hypothetical protein